MSIACRVAGIPEEARAAHAALARRLFTVEVQERKPIEGGRAFRFQADALAALAAFVQNERRCCPFLTFRLSLTPDGVLWMELTGPEGTGELLDHELPS